MSLRNKEKLRFRLESWRKKHLVVFILLLFVLYNVFCCLFSTDKCSLIKNLLNWYSDPDSALDSLFRSITNFTYVCSSRSLYRKDIHSIVVCVWCCFFCCFFREFVCRRLTALLLVVLFLRRESKLNLGGRVHLIISSTGMGWVGTGRG